MYTIELSISFLNEAHNLRHIYSAKHLTIIKEITEFIIKSRFRKILSAMYLIFVCCHKQHSMIENDRHDRIINDYLPSTKCSVSQKYTTMLILIRNVLLRSFSNKSTLIFLIF